MSIQDVINTIKKAQSKIATIFRCAYRYCGGSFYLIDVLVYNNNTEEKLKEAAAKRYNLESQAIIDPTVQDNPDIREIANAIGELYHPITLVIVGVALREFDINQLISLVKKIRHSLTLKITNIKMRPDNAITIYKMIKEAHCPITLIFENTELDSASAILADIIKEVRVPITLDLKKSTIGMVELLLAALNKAQAPANISLDTFPNSSIHTTYKNIKQDNFVVEARINPSNFFTSLGSSMINFTLNTLLSWPTTLIDLMKSYIGSDDLAWIEVLAIRDVKSASHENKYSSIDKSALMLKYFPQQLLAKLLNLLSSSSQLIHAESLPDEFQKLKALIKLSALALPSMTIPDGFDNVPGDGLCFYHAVARQLGNVSGAALQRDAVNEILENYQRYQDFIEGSFWDDNLESPGQNNRGWAGHVMIQAVANMLHMPIEIRRFGLDGSENFDRVLVLPYRLNPDHQELRLGNIANLHFVTANDIQPAEHEGSIVINQELPQLSGDNTKPNEDL